jgi:hypothetical protein
MKREKGVGNLPVVELYSSKDSAVHNIQTGFICYINYLNMLMLGALLPPPFLYLLRRSFQ